MIVYKRELQSVFEISNMLFFYIMYAEKSKN